MTFTPFEVIIGTYDGKLYGFIITQSIDGQFTLQSTFVVDDSSQAIRSLSFTRSGLLVATSNDCLIRIYNLCKHKYVAVLDKHTSSVRCSVSIVSKSAEGNEEYVLTGGDDKMLYLWRVQDWETMLTLRRHRHPICSVAVHASGFCASSLDKDGIVIWDLTNGNSVTRVQTDRQCYYHEWYDQELLLVHPTGIQLINIGDAPSKVEWTIPKVGQKVSAAIFGRWPHHAKGVDRSMQAVLAGDESGILRVFQHQKDQNQLVVVAKFQLWDESAGPDRDAQRIKFIKQCSDHYYMVGFSSGDMLLLNAIDLHDIEICKRFHVPGRPTSIEIYKGQLDKHYMPEPEKEN